MMGALVRATMALAAVLNPCHHFGRAPDVPWRAEAQAARRRDDAGGAPESPLEPDFPPAGSRGRETAGGFAAVLLHAPVASASAVPSSGRGGTGSPP